MSAPAELALGTSPSRREMMLWGAAGLVVLLAHSAFALAFNRVTVFTPPPEAAEQAMEIELTPLPVTLPEIVGAESFVEPMEMERIEPMEDEPTAEQIVPEEIQPVDPDLAMAESPEPYVLTPTETVEPEPVDTVQAEPEPVETVETDRQPVEAVEAEQAESAPVETDTIEAVASEAEIVEPPIPETITPEVALAVPTPKPVIEPVEEEQPRPKQAKPGEAKPKERPREKTAQRKPVEKPQQRPAEQEQPKKTAEKPAKVAKAKPPSSASSRAAQASKAPKINPARWHNAVRAAVARRVGRVRGEGSLSVSFVVNSSGAVISARIGLSSGNGRVDSAVLGAVRSARVPAPPAGIGSSTHDFTVPITLR